MKEITLDNANIQKEVYEAFDGMVFTNKHDCESYEFTIQKKRQKEEILALNTTELNEAVSKILGIENKQYSTNISDAFELVHEYGLLEENDSMLYKNFNDEWCIGGIYNDWLEEKVKAYTVPEIICRYFLIEYYDIM